MSSISGTVVSVSLSTKATKQDGGLYDAWELVYKDAEGRIKQLQKPITSLKYVKGLRVALEDLQPGDVFTAHQEKNARGYLEVQTIVKGEFAPPPVAGDPPKTGKVTGSNFETKEERELNRSRIVKQSSLSNAISTLTVGAKATPNTEAVLALAQIYYDWVYDNGTTGTTSEPS